MPRTLFLTIIFLIFIYLIFFFSGKSKNNNSDSKILTINNQAISVEFAKTPQELAKGLSGRKDLCSNCGMLFIFPVSHTLSFWMKDTLIPLDIIFMDSTGKITDIYTAPTEINTPQKQLKIYQSSSPAIYCLELNAGKSMDLNLQVGDIISL